MRWRLIPGGSHDHDEPAPRLESSQEPLFHWCPYRVIFGIEKSERPDFAGYWRPAGHRARSAPRHVLDSQYLLTVASGWANSFGISTHQSHGGEHAEITENHGLGNGRDGPGIRSLGGNADTGCGLRSKRAGSRSDRAICGGWFSPPEPWRL